MTLVATTLGMLPVDQLGRINAHEHIIIDGGLTVVKEPDFRLDSVEKAIEELTRWRSAGGGAIVDTMPFGCGRNPAKLIAISEATRIPIIVPTGFQKSSYYLPDHWQHRYDSAMIGELLIAELRDGVDQHNYDNPFVQRSPIRAGFIKVAGDYQFVAPTTRKLIEAAAIAHHATGAPILVHTEIGTVAHELLDLLEAAAIAPQHVMLCHVDRNPDPELHLTLAQRGAFLEYDTPARIKYQPETVVIGLMQQLFAAGYGDRVLLGGDMARRSYWRAYGGGPGIDYLLTSFTHRLHRAGFDETALDMIWYRNPARWLVGNPAR
ncbi:MAG TPA: hypothetical protein PKC19_10715 [Roseiflexaceae bacterium]|nr:hypothetical protein [Roseiflexaceae bacterium]